MSNYSVEAEQAVLGALMLQGSALREIDLSADDFAVEDHQELYKAITDAAREDGATDMVTVSKRTGGGNVAYLSEIQRNTPSAANIGAYAKIVKERAQQRKAVEIAESLTLAVESEGMAAVDHAVSRLLALGQSSRQHEFTIKEALSAAYRHIEAAHNGDQDTVPTGLRDLDSALGGLHRTDLVVVGARPAIGKTAFMLNLALNARCHVGIVSGEQPHDQIGMRALAREAKVALHKMRTASMEPESWQRLPPAVASLTEADNVRIMDKSGPSIAEVARQARKWKHTFDVQAIYVDYIQKLRGTNQRASKREQIDEIVAALKDLARELDIPIVALAQVNRECENRTDKRPGLADLKESGSIEQEADAIITLYRDEVYNPDSDFAGIMEANVVKNRHGPVGRNDLLWTPEFLQVSDKAMIYISGGEVE